MHAEAPSVHDNAGTTSGFTMGTPSASQEGEVHPEMRLLLQLLLEQAEAISRLRGTKRDEFLAELVEFARCLGWEPQDDGISVAEERRRLHPGRLCGPEKKSRCTGRSFEVQNDSYQRTERRKLRLNSYSSSVSGGLPVQRRSSAPPARTRRLASFSRVDRATGGCSTPISLISVADARASPPQRAHISMPAVTRDTDEAVGARPPARDLAKAPIAPTGIFSYFVAKQLPAEPGRLEDTHVGSAFRDREKLIQAASVLEHLEDRDALLLCRIKQLAVAKVIRDLYGVQWDGEICLIECLISRAYAAVGYGEQAKQHLETAAVQLAMLATGTDGQSHEECKSADALEETTDIATDETVSGAVRTSQAATDFVEVLDGKNEGSAQKLNIKIRRRKWKAEGKNIWLKHQTSASQREAEKHLVARSLITRLAAKVQSVCGQKREISFDLLRMEFFHSIGDLCLAEGDAVHSVNYFRLAIHYAQRALETLHLAFGGVAAPEAIDDSSAVWETMPREPRSDSSLPEYDTSVQEHLDLTTVFGPMDIKRDALPDVKSVDGNATRKLRPDVQWPSEASTFLGMERSSDLGQVEAADPRRTFTAERQAELLQSDTGAESVSEEVSCWKIKASIRGQTLIQSAAGSSGEEAEAALKLLFRRAELLSRVAEASLELQEGAAVRESREAVVLFSRLTGGPNSLRSLQARYVYAQALCQAGWVQEAYEAFVAIMRLCVATENTGREVEWADLPSNVSSTVSSTGKLGQSEIYPSPPPASSVKSSTFSPTSRLLDPPFATPSTASPGSSSSASAAVHESHSSPTANSGDAAVFRPLTSSVFPCLRSVRSVLSRISTATIPYPLHSASRPSSSAAAFACCPSDAHISADASSHQLQQHFLLLLRCTLAVAHQFLHLSPSHVRHEARSLTSSIFRAFALHFTGQVKKDISAVKATAADGSDGNSEGAGDKKGHYYLGSYRGRQSSSRKGRGSALASREDKRKLRNGIRKGAEEAVERSVRMEGEEIRLTTKRQDEATQNQTCHITGESISFLDNDGMGSLLSELGSLLMSQFRDSTTVNEEEALTTAAMMEYTELKYGEDSEQFISLLLQKAENQAARGNLSSAITDSKRALQIIDDNYLLITSSEKAMAERAKTYLEIYAAAQKGFSRRGSATLTKN